MRYITSIYALQFDLVEDMGCDWHSSSLDWSKTTFKESEESIFKDFGIKKTFSPYLAKEHFVAISIRACLEQMKKIIGL